MAVVTYADDITIFVTAPEEITVIEEALRCYERATGARLNIEKSHTLAVGTWDTTRRVMDIPYNNEIKVLGIHLANTMAQSAMSSWARITTMVRIQAQEVYARDLDLVQRIQYIHTYLLAKLWHTAQVLLPPNVSIRQIVTAVSWFIWHGDIFQVPLSTLQKKKEEGVGA